jgi:hypothetical protein
MKNVWKLVCLLGIIALIAVTAFAWAVLSQAPPAAVLLPVFSVCAVLLAGSAVRSINAAFTKRCTTATGVG